MYIFVINCLFVSSIVLNALAEENKEVAHNSPTNNTGDSPKKEEPQNFETFYDMLLQGKLPGKSQYNLKLDKLERVIWVSKAKGIGSKAVMLMDGTVCILDEHDEIMWSASMDEYENLGSKGFPQKDGNLVIYDLDCALWDSRTGPCRNCKCTSHKIATTRTLKSYSDSSEDDYGGSPESEEENAATNTDSSTKAEELQGNVTLENDSGVYFGNSKLKMGKSWKSKSKNITLKMQLDGNLVLHDQFGRPVWASETMRDGQEAEFRPDGNFVVYSFSKRLVWSSQTDGHPDSKLVVQDDGNVVIYHGDDPIWSSGTEACSNSKYKRHPKSGPVEGNVTANNELLAPFGLEKGQWWEFDSGTLLMQEDGNLVLRNKLDKVIWDSNTKGSGLRALFQEDGRIVIYSDSWRPVWSSTISKYSGAKIVPQKDGNLGIYSQYGTLVWASYTDRVINGDNTDVDIQTSQTKHVRGNSRLNRGESWSSEKSQLTMQQDGNLVLYDLMGKAQWNSGTTGKGWRAVFQIDGNFVVYSKTWKSVWESGTSGHLNSTLAVQNDGNVVIYNGCRPIWSTRNYD